VVETRSWAPALRELLVRTGSTAQQLSGAYIQAGAFPSTSTTLGVWDVMAAALIDRLVHHCHLVNIRGNS
jgi:hypothetical protein